MTRWVLALVFSNRMNLCIVISIESKCSRIGPRCLESKHYKNSSFTDATLPAKGAGKIHCLGRINTGQLVASWYL
jgi:hypothetical protein